jgi:hypothetical protein
VLSLSVAVEAAEIFILEDGVKFLEQGARSKRGVDFVRVTRDNGSFSFRHCSWRHSCASLAPVCASAERFFAVPSGRGEQETETPKPP